MSPSIQRRVDGQVVVFENASQRKASDFVQKSLPNLCIITENNVAVYRQMKPGPFVDFGLQLTFAPTGMTEKQLKGLYVSVDNLLNIFFLCRKKESWPDFKVSQFLSRMQDHERPENRPPQIDRLLAALIGMKDRFPQMANGLVGRSVEDKPERTFPGVLNKEDDGLTKIRIDQSGRSDQKLSDQRHFFPLIGGILD